MSAENWNKLEAFIRKETGISPKKAVNADTDVVYDLGQEGDEADEFMQKFFREFGISTGDYDFHRYFLMEGEGMLYHLVKQYLFRKPHTLKRRKLTVGMLFKALEDKEWDSARLSSCQRQ